MGGRPKGPASETTLKELRDRLPVRIGTNTASASLSVVYATDGSPVPIIDRTPKRPSTLPTQFLADQSLDEEDGTFVSPTNPLPIAVMDSNGEQITDFRAGVQYFEGQTTNRITGTAVMVGGTGTDVQAVSADNPMPVTGEIAGTVTVTGVATEVTLLVAATSLAIMDDWDESDRCKVNPIVGGAGVQGGSGTATAITQRVTLATDIALPTGTNSIGQVTANAGTNLNTSALALESGGNLAGAATSLAIIDDWDESDRAKVNPIAGQAGVQGGSGTATALTQRVTLATDIALPAGTNTIGAVTTTQTLATATWQAEASIAGTSTTSSYTSVLNLSDNTKLIMMRNTINNTIIISFDNSTAHMTLDRTIGAVTIDLASLGLKTTDTVYIKHAGTTPTAGKFYVNGVS